MAPSPTTSGWRLPRRRLQRLDWDDRPRRDLRPAGHDGISPRHRPAPSASV